MTGWPAGHVMSAVYCSESIDEPTGGHRSVRSRRAGLQGPHVHEDEDTGTTLRLDHGFDIPERMSEPRLRRLPTTALDPAEIAGDPGHHDPRIRRRRGGALPDDDWAHALGGVHVVLDIDGEIVSHAAVVERELWMDDRPLRTGYVEAVATTPDRQGQGLGSLVMAEVNAIIRERFELGALGTGSNGFYERLGWVTWRGPTFVRTQTVCSGRRTRTAGSWSSTRRLRRRSTSHASLSCEWRPGDVW